MNKRNNGYDLIRIIAMLLVVACHSFGDTRGASSAILSLLSYLEMPCNGLFFAVSGALLLPLSDTNHFDTFSFITRRINKVVIPTFIWSVFYLIVLTCSGKYTFFDFFVRMCSMPFSPQGAPILWFMYVMIGLYLIAPIISPWLHQCNKRILEFYLAIWSVSLSYPILSNWLYLDMSNTGPLYYLSGYVGFFVLGFYLKRFGIQFKLSAILYVVVFGIMILSKLFAPNVCLYDGFWYVSIFCAINVVFYWNCIVKIAEKIKNRDRVNKKIMILSNLVFGVYFVHWGIMEYLIPYIPFDTMPYLIGYSLRILISFVGAVAISYFLSLLPFGNYIIGYKQKR